MNYFLMPRYMFFEVMKNFDSFFDDFTGPQLLLVMVSWLRNGRSYEQLDHCGHHGISCLTWGGIFVEKNQKAETFCKSGDFLLRGGFASPLFFCVFIAMGARCEKNRNIVVKPIYGHQQWTMTCADPILKKTSRAHGAKGSREWAAIWLTYHFWHQKGKIIQIAYLWHSFDPSNTTKREMDSKFEENQQRWQKHVGNRRLRYATGFSKGFQYGIVKKITDTNVLLR